MNDLALPSPLQQAALAYYRWYLDKIDCNVIADQLLYWVSSAFRISITKRDLQLTFERLHGTTTYLDRRDKIVEKWRGAFEASGRNPGDTLSRKFLNYLVSELEQDKLAVNAISVGLMRVNAGEFGDGLPVLASARDYWTLHINLWGKATYKADISFTATRGDIMLIRPDALCQCQRAPESPRWVQGFVTFHPKAEWATLLQWPEVASGVYRARIENLSQHQTMRSLMGQAHETLQSNLPHSEDLAFNLFEQLLIRIKQQLPLPHRDALDTRISLACQYIQSNLTSPVSVETVASHCNLSASRLAHLFKQQLNQSLQQYRIKLRIDYAEELLLNTELKIIEIASRLGYAESQNFSRQFRIHKGLTPKQYRARFGRL